MTSKPDDDAIEIHVHIKIPFRGQPVEINESRNSSNESSSQAVTATATSAAAAESAAKSAPAKGPAKLLSVLLPASGQTHDVRSIGSGLTEFTAAGVISNSSVPANEVRLSCGGTTVTAIPDPSTGEWYHAAVPGAKCSYTPTYPSNVLTVQYFRNGAPTGDTETVQFYGKCAGSAAYLNSVINNHIAFLPTGYQVSVGGFSHPLDHFNGQWKLAIVPCSAAGPIVRWRFELPNGDGHIEFSADTKKMSAELMFKKDSAEIRYSKSDGKWVPMNLAEFADCKCRFLAPGVSIPAVVQVGPA